ncbi:MAG: 3,4-dihydroxy-2-butanone-4-phosphate synthase, partial [Acetobacter malorum]
MAAQPSEAMRRAVEALRAGRMVIMVDDEDRENEGDLVMAAEFMTPDAMNFMITHARGLVCLPLTPAQVDKLQLPMMVRDNTARHGTAFTVSIEAREGVTTGISAADRAHTIQVAASDTAQPMDLATPGHIFPLRAAPGGVLERIGHTEGSIDLLRLAGLRPAAVICEILNEDGTMARRPALEVYGQQHDMPIISIAELVTWISAHGLMPLASDADIAAAPSAHPETVDADGVAEEAMADLATAALPSAYGGEDLAIHAFRDSRGVEHVALVKGNPAAVGAVPLVRMHSE